MNFEGGGVGAVTSIAPAANGVHGITGLDLDSIREICRGTFALKIDDRVEEGFAVVEDVEVGGGGFGNTLEGGSELDFVVGGGGLADDGVFAILAGMEGDLSRLPGNAQSPDSMSGAVASDARVGPVRIAPGNLSGNDARGMATRSLLRRKTAGTTNGQSFLAGIGLQRLAGFLQHPIRTLLTANPFHDFIQRIS